jgi:hypothetical protein
MRFLLAGFLVSALGLSASCTTTDPAPIYVDMTYQLRCIDCQPRVPVEPVHDIMHLDGEAGYHMECFVSSSGGKRQLTVIASQSDSAHPDQDHSFRITQARFESKDPGSECEVRASEGGNTYVGKCTGGAPTATAPCQLTFKVNSGIVNGTVYCDNIPNPTSSPETTRYLVAPFEANKPAKFEVHGCAGL